MDYFDREERNEALINESLRGLIENCRGLLKKGDIKDCIRLHESTLDVDELYALNKAYLEGNITMEKLELQ